MVRYKGFLDIEQKESLNDDIGSFIEESACVRLNGFLRNRTYSYGTGVTISVFCHQQNREVRGSTAWPQLSGWDPK